MTAHLGESEPSVPLLRVVRDDERAVDLPPNIDHLPLSVIVEMPDDDGLHRRIVTLMEDREHLSAELDRARDELEVLRDVTAEIRHLLPERTRDFWEASRILRNIADVLDAPRRPSW